MISYDKFASHYYEANLINLIDPNYHFICPRIFMGEPAADLAFSIAHHYKNLYQRKIYFTMHDEPLTIYWFNKLTEVANLLIHEYKIDIKFLNVISCLHPCDRNRNLYKKYCQYYEWLDIPLLYSNHWEFEAQKDIISDLSLYDNLNTNPRTKTKKFLCYNNIIRVHRACVLGEIIRRNLLDMGYISCMASDISKLVGSLDTTDNDIQIFHDTRHLLLDKKSLFPMNLSFSEFRRENDQVKTNQMMINKKDIELFNDSYFSLVTETAFFNKVNPHAAPAISFSEKTFKPIKAKHPFILVAPPYTLRHIKEVGYKTFDPFINESYDSIEDDEKRLIAVMDEVERLCHLSDNDWIEIQYQLKEVVEHNYDLLLTKKYRILYDQDLQVLAKENNKPKPIIVRKNFLKTQTGL